MSIILELHHIYVSQGDATIIVVRDSATSIIKKKVLIDSGEYGSKSSLIGYCTSKLNNLHFDYIFVSHYHGDHWGYFYKASGITYDKIVSNGFGDLDAKDYGKLGLEKYFTDFADSSKHTQIDWSSPKFEIYTGIDLTCYAAFGHTSTQDVLKLKERLAINPNSCSMVFVLTYDKFSYYTGGDITGGIGQDMETALSKIVPENVTVMKASHHGSTESNNAAILNRLNPETIVNFTFKTCSLPSVDYMNRIKNMAAAKKRLKGYYIINDLSVTEALIGYDKNCYNAINSIESKGVEINLDKTTRTLGDGSTVINSPTYINSSAACIIRYPKTDSPVTSPSTKTIRGDYEVEINKYAVSSVPSRKRPASQMVQTAPDIITIADFEKAVNELNTKKLTNEALYLQKYYTQFDDTYMYIVNGAEEIVHNLLVGILEKAGYEVRRFRVFSTGRVIELQ